MSTRRPLKDKPTDPDPAFAVRRRVDRDAAPVPPQQQLRRRNNDNNNGTSSKLPQWLKLPLLVVLSLNLSAMLYSLSARYLGTDMDFAVVSRSIEGEGDWWEGMAVAGTLVGWRM